MNRHEKQMQNNTFDRLSMIVTIVINIYSIVQFCYSTQKYMWIQLPHEHGYNGPKSANEY
jgi:hypothetical protein